MKRWRAKNVESRKAYMDAYREANRGAITEQYRRWRIANAQLVTEKNQRRRARLLDAFVAPVNRDQVWERDNGCCQLCGNPIDRSIQWPHPLSMTIDHIRPLILGGTHEPSNVQLAHAVCNSRKGDRIDALHSGEAA
jgi:5-methylcytosine-specific restriction endonuclease McrA